MALLAKTDHVCFGHVVMIVERVVLREKDVSCLLDGRREGLSLIERTEEVVCEHFYLSWKLKRYSAVE